jgi:hypothetical protein
MKKLSISSILILFLYFQCTGQSSINLVGNARWGVESIPLFIDNYNNKVTLSTGSGIAAGGEFSYDFTWLFNLSTDVMFHYSNLSQRAENASGHFIGMETHLTPSLTIPARENPAIKVYLGAGPGLYTFSTIKVFAKDAGGDNLIFKYSPTIGYHAQILFKIRSNSNGHIVVGARYYLISYKFTEKGSTHYTNIKEINNPNGSGISLFVSLGQSL